MPRTQKQNEKSILWNATTKLKYLSNLAGTSKAIVIPSSFLEALNIDKKTLLIMTINTINEQIIIEKVKNPEKYSIKPRKLKNQGNDNEEADYIITE